MENTNTNFLTKDQLAKELGINPRTVSNYRKQGMPAMVGSYKMIRYDLNQVREWLVNKNKRYAIK